MKSGFVRQAIRLITEPRPGERLGRLDIEFAEFVERNLSSSSGVHKDTPRMLAEMFIEDQKTTRKP